MVVIDKFHVERLANDALDTVRRSVTKTGPYTLKQNRGVFLAREGNFSERAIAIRDEWCVKYPLLGQVYSLKEAFFHMCDFRIFEIQCSRFKMGKLPLAQILRSCIIDRYSGVPTR